MVRITVSAADNGASSTAEAMPNNVGVSTAVNTAAARNLPGVPATPIATVDVPRDTVEVRTPYANAPPAGGLASVIVSALA